MSHAGRRGRVRWPDVAALALVVLTIAATVTVYGDLPTRMVVGWHVGLDGAVAHTHGPRALAAALVPGLLVSLYAVFAAIPRIGDLGDDLEPNRWIYDLIVHAALGALCAIQAFILVANVN